MENHYKGKFHLIHLSHSKGKFIMAGIASFQSLGGRCPNQWTEEFQSFRGISNGPFPEAAAQIRGHLQGHYNAKRRNL